MIGLFFGSTTANTERIAEIIWDKLYDHGCDIHDIRTLIGSESKFGIKSDNPDIAKYDKIILMIPTWDFGEWQEDWENLLPIIKEIDWKDKIVALIGLGDQIGYHEYYQDCMGMMYDIITPLGAKCIGFTSTDGYEFTASKAVRDNKFVGLAIDEDSQPELTMERIDKWLDVNTKYLTENLLQLNDPIWDKRWTAG